MRGDAHHVIRVAAALIDDGAGRLLLVRKAGTKWFMQVGGKIEEDESLRDALRRELIEEIGLVVGESDLHHLGRYRSLAANEVGCHVEAELFRVQARFDPVIQSEIEEAVWVDPAEASMLPLAPLTRDHVLPLFRALTGS